MLVTFARRRGWLATYVLALEPCQQQPFLPRVAGSLSVVRSTQLGWTWLAAGFVRHWTDEVRPSSSRSRPRSIPACWDRSEAGRPYPNCRHSPCTLPGFQREPISERRSGSPSPTGLLPDRFIIQVERRLWRRIKPRMPMMKRGDVSVGRFSNMAGSNSGRSQSSPDSRRLPHRHGGRCSTGTIVVVSVEMHG